MKIWGSWTPQLVGTQCVGLGDGQGGKVGNLKVPIGFNIHDLDDLGNPDFRKCPEMSKCPYNGSILMDIIGVYQGDMSYINGFVGESSLSLVSTGLAAEGWRQSPWSVSITKNMGIWRSLSDLQIFLDYLYRFFVIPRCLQTFGLLVWYSVVQQWGFCGLSSCGLSFSCFLEAFIVTIVFAGRPSGSPRKWSCWIGNSW